MKIFYMSCHCVHEFDEVRMFHKLGYEIFSPSSYSDPQFKDHLRPGIDGLVYDPTWNDKYKAICTDKIDGKDNLNEEFLSEFDVVFVMSLSDRWIVEQWDVLKDKIVVWRSNGQSDPEKEYRMKALKRKYSNLKIVRYSPTERTYGNYAGEDAVIRFGKRPDEYDGYNGDCENLMTICQNLKGRRESCSWDLYNKVAKDFSSILYGISNEGNKYWIGRKLYTPELVQALRDNRVYFYLGTKPANYTLNFIEAWMTGIPIVALGPELGNADGFNTYEIHKLITNGVDGFIGDDSRTLKKYIRTLMGDQTLCKKVSEAGRKSAMKHFNEYDKEKEWKEFFDSL